MNKRTLTTKQIELIIHKHQQELKNLGVKRLGLFGSFAYGKPRTTSDIDFVVEFDHPSFKNFMQLVFLLESLTGRSIDLLTPEGISPYLKPYIINRIKWYET